MNKILISSYKNNWTIKTPRKVELCPLLLRLRVNVAPRHKYETREAFVAASKLAVQQIY